MPALSAPLAGVDVGRVDELYQKTVTDPDAFPIEDGQLDLLPLVRETVLLAARRRAAVPPGLRRALPVCGIDRNAESCDCVDRPSATSAGRSLDELDLDR